VKITKRDVELLRFLSQWQFVSVEQSGQFLKCSYEVARRRLKGLADYGLVEVDRPFSDMRKLYWVSNEGLRFLGERVGVSRGQRGVRLAQWEHDAILVDIALDFLAKNPGYQVFGEAGMRRSDMQLIEQGEEPRFAFRRYAGGRWVWVFPDMAAIKGENIFIVEYEHTKKARQRLESLLRTYANESRFAAVQYYASADAFPQLERVYKPLESSLPLYAGKPRLRIKQWS
jgi:hypothetical protein